MGRRLRPRFGPSVDSFQSLAVLIVSTGLHQMSTDLQIFRQLIYTGGVSVCGRTLPWCPGHRVDGPQLEGPMSEEQVELSARGSGRPSPTSRSTAGVSRAAVSKVIRNAYGVSPAMRKRVEAAIEELGYRPRVAARAMRGASFTIGFEIPSMGNDFFRQVVEGAATSLAASGYQLIIAPGLGYLSGTSVLDALVDRQVDGIIATSDGVSRGLAGTAGRVRPAGPPRPPRSVPSRTTPSPMTTGLEPTW